MHFCLSSYYPLNQANVKCRKACLLDKVLAVNRTSEPNSGAGFIANDSVQKQTF